MNFDEATLCICQGVFDVIAAVVYRDEPAAPVATVSYASSRFRLEPKTEVDPVTGRN
jgi:hypothetical protein